MRHRQPPPYSQMEMSHVRNPQVIAALEHVRTFRPEVTQVFYTNELKWLYMTDDGDAPAFGGEIDTSLLEDAVDSLDTFPAAFHITSQFARQTHRTI